MRALVVYESMYGSTRAVAQSAAQGLGESMEVEVVEVGELAAGPRGGALAPDVDLLVVGGPTHAFSMTRASTREDAGKETTQELVSPGIGIREWLDALELPEGLRFATFDTKVAKPNLPGSAAKAAAKRLTHLGGRPVTRARTFLVSGKAEGLVGGQLEAAQAWGAEVGRSFTPVG